MSYSEKRKQIDELQQKIDAYGALDADVKKKISYKFRLDWNYYSNSMEGNTLTMEETRSVMVGNLTVGGKPIKDVLEMKGHDEIITEILRVGKAETRLSEARIRSIHKGIMHEEDETQKKKIGIWKTEPNYIYNYKNERFDFVLPAEVPERMHELLNKTNAGIDAIINNKKGAPHPIDIALQFHLDYVLIHPFYDGNGRTARILTNLLLISFGYPPSWIRADERKIYNQYIADIQGYGGNPDLFFEFAAGLILRSQKLVLDAIEGKNIEEPDDLLKEISIWKKQLGNDAIEAKPKSDDMIVELYIKCLNSMYEMFVAKMQNAFYDLFADWEVRGWVNNSNENHKDKSLVDDKMSILSEKLANPPKERSNLQDNKEINLIAVTINMLGFKKDGINAFNANAEIRTRFEPYKYVISLTPQITIEKLYGQWISNTEQIELINDSVREIFFYLKQQMKNPPLSNV